jgi:hypothetical protein
MEFVESIRQAIVDQRFGTLATEMIENWNSGSKD